MKNHISLLLVCLLALFLHVFFWNYTNYTAEDAYITYQFAKQIHTGNGFVFNTGVPIYGTTTPLFALILAGWLFVSDNIVLGSKIIGLAAMLGGLIFLYFSFRDKKAGLIAISIMTVSLKLIAEQTMGMETPLIFLFMAGSLWGYSKNKPYFTGLMCGLLLWTRVDTVVYVVVLLASHVYQRKEWEKFLVGTLIYVPWIVFATLYFGSPIPHTITAKIVAYAINAPPLKVHLARIIHYLSVPMFALVVVSILRSKRRNPFLAWFFIADCLYLAYSQATFEDRYFYSLYLVAVIILSIEISNARLMAWRVILISAMLFASINPLKTLAYYKDYQTYRFDVLANIGLWLNKNTPADATIQAVDMGYIPFHANRFFVDEVGLITPESVELHRQRIGAEYFYRYFWTDYIIYQCHQGDSVMDDFSQYYKLIKTFENGFARACYEVWERDDG